MGRLAEEQRRQLFALFGPERAADVDYKSPQVCRDFLVGVCLHDLFSNTRLGLAATCPKIHDVKLKADFDAAINAAELDEQQLSILESFYREHERNLRRFVAECDIAIRKHNKRLDKTPEENNRAMSLMRDIAEFESLMQTTLASAEALGESGEVDQAQSELKRLEVMKEEKESKEAELKELTETAGASGPQRLRVCDTCGAYLSILDSDRRLADHFGGKMHLGYAQIREYVDKCKTESPIPAALQAKRQAMSSTKTKDMNGVGGHDGHFSTDENNPASSNASTQAGARRFDPTDDLIRHALKQQQSRKRKSPEAVRKDYARIKKKTVDVEDGEEGEVADG